MSEDDGLFEWPRWLVPLLRSVGKGLVGLVAFVVVAILVMIVAMLMMNAVAPTRDTTVPAVGVGIAVVAIAGLAITWKVRRQ